jgi:hypothetical protein
MSDFFEPPAPPPPEERSIIGGRRGPSAARDGAAGSSARARPGSQRGHGAQLAPSARAGVESDRRSVGRLSHKQSPLWATHSPSTRRTRTLAIHLPYMQLHRQWSALARTSPVGIWYLITTRFRCLAFTRQPLGHGAVGRPAALLRNMIAEPPANRVVRSASGKRQ